MGVDVFQIGVSGLQAAQIGIAVTGQNISNANTPGYNQEVAKQVSSPSQGFGFGFIGQGTEVSTITRQFNQLITNQINATQSTSSQLTSYLNQITPITNMVANPTAGLSPVLQSFFSSLQNLSANPSAVSAQQSTMSSAQTLVSQFHTLQDQFNQSSAGVNAQISNEVNTINSYAQQIAEVNKAIQIGYASGSNQPPNTLLDQRDTLINNLSKETQVTVVPQGNQFNVFIGNGQPLVIAGQASTLQTVPSATNPGYTDVAYTINGVAQPISESSLPGGTLGGLFAYRTNSLSPVQNTIGQIAIVLGSSLNAQNQLGQTNSGAMGQALFTIASPVVYPNSHNAGNAQVGAGITNAGALTSHDYTLSYDGTNYTITDNTLNTVKSTFAAFPGVPTQGVNVIDGVTYTLSSGAMTAGDSFLISPTSAGATGFGLATTDPTAIASTAPIATKAANTNTGTGVITPGSVSTGFAPAAVAPPITLTYNSGTNSLSGFPAGSTIVVTNNGVATTYPGYVPGTPIPYTSGMSMAFNNMTVGLSGTPANGDAYTVGPNTNATGDSRNILLMNALLTKSTMNNATTTFQDVYAQMVNSVGNTTSQLTTLNTTESNLLTAATTQQQSLSGVNLDQETVNLIRYQQAYQAAGKIIQIASQNFATVLSLNGG